MYLDAAADRMADAAHSDFVADVETNRAGAIFAHDQRQYARWRANADRRSKRAQPGLSGAALESALMRIADLFPQNVTWGTV